jgi:hypothetical protein
LKSYTIHRAAQTVPMIGDPSAGPWKSAEVTHIDQFPWYKAGVKQDTQVRVLYDDQAVYSQFICEDRHIFAQITQVNGNVCLDSAVEFFATIEPERGPHFFNLEMNCCGVPLFGFGPQRQGRISITPDQASRIPIATSVPGPTKAESPSDNGWWAVATIPFDFLREFTGRPVAPKAGTRWLANFFRCGGKTDYQFASWNNIVWKQPDFHRPEFFGELLFA